MDEFALMYDISQPLIISLQTPGFSRQQLENQGAVLIPLPVSSVTIMAVDLSVLLD